MSLHGTGDRQNGSGTPSPASLFVRRQPVTVLPKSTYSAKRGNAAVVCVPCCRYACVAAPWALVTRHSARWLSVERSARPLAYSMRSSGVSRYVIAGCSCLSATRRPWPTRRLRGCVINHYAVEWPLVKGLTNFQVGGFPADQSGFPGRARRAPRRARSAMAPSRPCCRPLAAPPTRPRLGAPTPPTRGRLTALRRCAPSFCALLPTTQMRMSAVTPTSPRSSSAVTPTLPPSPAEPASGVSGARPGALSRYNQVRKRLCFKSHHLGSLGFPGGGPRFVSGQRD